MSETTGISWTEATWNPWLGCTKVSPGCAHCYMFREQRQYGQNPELVRRSKTKFRDPLKWREARLIFTCSWSDWFHEAADAWRPDAWEIIRQTPQHTYQILTKRPERIAHHLPPDWGAGYPNVWLGVSVETQRWVERIAILAHINAAVRFVSAEPLIGPVDLMRIRPDLMPLCLIETVDWVIVGGESGPRRRPMAIEWVRDIYGQCKSAGVALFVKQDAGPLPGMQGRIPDDLWIKEFPDLMARSPEPTR